MLALYQLSNQILSFTVNLGFFAVYLIHFNLNSIYDLKSMHGVIHQRSNLHDARNHDVMHEIIV